MRTEYGDTQSYAYAIRSDNISVQSVKADRSWHSQVEAFKTAINFHPAKTLDRVIAGAGIFSETSIALEDEPSLTSLDEDAKSLRL